MTSPPPNRRSGIVLAGGRSARFGTDKLAADAGGRPLVHLPIEALAMVCDEVVVVVGAHGVPPLPRGLGVPLRVVRDEEPGGGPLAALLTGLREAIGGTVLVVAGDMPQLVPGVLSELARRVEVGTFQACLVAVGDRPSPLPIVARRDAALASAEAVRTAGGSSLRALIDMLDVEVVAEADWRLLDPDGGSVRDVDRPADLQRLLADPPERTTSSPAATRRPTILRRT